MHRPLAAGSKDTGLRKRASASFDFSRWLFALLAMVADSPIRADSPTPPRSYKEVARGEKFVFAMIAPGTVEDDVWQWNEETAASIRAIRRAYTRSGMYRNDGSAEPLWTVDWYAHRVEVASDGMHLVRHGPWASSTDQEAVSFFADGKLLRSYSIRELIDNRIMLARTSAHFFWQEEGRFDDDQLKYALATKDGNQFVFDVRTGEIVSQFRLAPVALWGMAAVFGVGFLGLLVWLVRHRRLRLQAARG
jgi:hypothetical protein